MEERKRRRFTAEYGAEAVKRLEESGKALHQVADERVCERCRDRGIGSSWHRERVHGRVGTTLG